MDYKKIAADWDRIFGPVHPFDTSLLLAAASDKARTYVGVGRAALTLTPGNGYEYRMLLHDLDRDAMDVLKNFDDPAGGQPLEDFRVQAEGLNFFGGELLVALPAFHRCLVLNHNLHTPDYLNEKLDIGMTHCVPLAVFLSSFSERVELDRKET